ncbi:DUF3492 domain-containing protein [Streptomyces sp. NPDC005863]|uniref:DUF3492 domain-containing protein n=1 Tax=unclassified Streptomyces TaxID=2593676 RepID=UPI0034106418
MRVGLLTEGGYPYVSGEARLWCDRLVRGLGQHEFDVYALSRSEQQEAQGWVELPPQIGRVRTAPLWNADDEALRAAGPRGGRGRRARRRFAECFGELADVVCRGGGAGADGPRSGEADGSHDDSSAGSHDGRSGDERDAVADRFSNALYGLAELARDEGGLVGALRSESAVRALERACRAPGALRPAHAARVPDLLTAAGLMERALRPLSLDWYDAEGLGAVDLCHAASGGPAALPGLLAGHFAGVPLLVTEYGVQLRAHHLATGDMDLSAPARALLASFHGLLAAEVYRGATLITPGNTHARRWQERCGADRAKLRTVHPGMAADRFTEIGEGGYDEFAADPDTLLWVGRIEPAKDLISLLHAFAEIRAEVPGARLRIVGAPADGPEARAYLAHCRALAAQLFPDEAAGAHAVGDNPVSFEEIGGPDVPELADAYACGGIVVLSSVVEGFPISLVEAMFCGRATVSTDVGAVVEVIGGTGLVVPPRNPRALAEACVALLRDPERRARLGAAARARALELFTVEQNVAAFRSIYLEIVSHCPVRRDAVDATGEPVPFAHPAEACLPGRWAVAVGPASTTPEPGTEAAGVPSWAAPEGPPTEVAEATGATRATQVSSAEASVRREGAAA